MTVLEQVNKVVESTIQSAVQSNAQQSVTQSSRASARVSPVWLANAFVPTLLPIAVNANTRTIGSPASNTAPSPSHSSVGANSGLGESSTVTSINPKGDAVERVPLAKPTASSISESTQRNSKDETDSRDKKNRGSAKNAI